MPETHFPLSVLPDLNPLIADYLNHKSSLQSFYNHTPDLNSIKSMVNEKENFPINRKVLTDVLMAQYKEVPENAEVNSNIELLEAEGTYTVCTGHQLGLFGGPVYTFYKAITTIALSQKIKTRYPEFNVVPIFWLAGEDHDFEEINHINLFGKRIEWPCEQSGAVGRMHLTGINAIKKQLFEILGENENSKDLKSLIDKCFQEEFTLIQATRLLIHSFFGSKGLVCLDADDKRLKQLFSDKMHREIMDGIGEGSITSTSESLSKNYKTQIHPRDINLFYLSKGNRTRLTRKDGEVSTVDGTTSFKLEEIEKELNLHPEKFSPNVALRPLYQECILPNLAYVGGTGEIAYWLQLKNMFDSFLVPFPILITRNSVVWMSNKTMDKWEELGFTQEDLFRDEQPLISKFAKSQNKEELSLMAEKEGAVKVFENVLKKSHQIDKSLVQIVEGEKQRLLGAIEGLEKKMLKAEKRKHREAFQRISNIRNQVFPEGTFQERKFNFMEVYLKHGAAFTDRILEKIDPFASDITLLTSD